MTWWHDPGPGRDDLEVAEALLSPAQERVALAVSLELELDVPREGVARAEQVDLNRVVDHELDRNQGIDLLRVPAEVGHRVPHRREIDDRRHAREVLQEHAGRGEGDLTRRLGARVPGCNRLDVVVAAVAEDVFEQHAKGVGKPRDVVCRLQRVQPEQLVRTVSDCQLGRRRHVSIQPDRRGLPRYTNCGVTSPTAVNSRTMAERQIVGLGGGGDTPEQTQLLYDYVLGLTGKERPAPPVRPDGGR